MPIPREFKPQKGENLIKVIKLTEEQWDIIGLLTPVGRAAARNPIFGRDEAINTIFDSIENILNAPKVVTLNGKAMWGRNKGARSIAERLEDFHSIFELPYGGFAVSSRKFSSDPHEKGITFDRSQCQIYDCCDRIIRPRREGN